MDNAVVDERVGAWLREIEKSSVSVQDEKDILTLSLPHDCFIKVNTAKGIWYIENFQVPENLSGQGIGSRLMESLSAEVKMRGIEKLSGSLKSIGALRVMEKVFGPDKLTFQKDFEARKDQGKDEVISREQAFDDFAHRLYVECEVNLKETTVSS